ncbi:MAG: hypothetical protein AAGB34_02770, partial [Planctomycetota bacterium]
MPAVSFTKPLLGAVFLACSWTWVIGMWFPVYLVRDFGWPGWVVFAIPNCLGAMSVGFVLANPDRLRRFRRNNREAIIAFGFITILFQLFLVSYLTLGSPVVALPVFVVIDDSVLFSFATLFFLLVVLFAMCLVIYGRPMLGSRTHERTRPRFRKYLLLAAGCILASGIVVALANESLTMPNNTGDRTRSELLYAAFPIVLGFLTCPYLDPSFLRLRGIMRGKSGTRAFAMSFGCLFPL